MKFCAYRLWKAYLGLKEEGLINIILKPRVFWKVFKRKLTAESIIYDNILTN